MVKSIAKVSKLLTPICLVLLIVIALALTGFSGGPGSGGSTGTANPVNVIKNGGFEERDPNSSEGSLPLYWQPYSNGGAFFGWYDETWPEAVYQGEHAQLMEIFLFHGDFQERVIAIHQTVGVTRNADYELTLQAILRSDAGFEYRNNNEIEMSWGVDFSGQGNYDNVDKWVVMPLTEQFRLGSFGETPDDVPLFYQTVTGTIRTGDSNQITLFIRGMKKFATQTEALFDVDEVSLVGPSSTTVIITPESPAGPTTKAGENLPASGGTLPRNLSLGVLLLGGVVLVLLGAMATANLLRDRNDV